MKRRRVKITGIGPVTPAGIGREAFWKGILEPVSRVRAYENLGTENGPFVAACIDRFSIGKYVSRDRLPKGIGRHTEFATVGALLALQDAGLTSADLSARDTLIVTGSSLMDFGSISSTTRAVYTRGPKAALPRTVYTATNTSVTETVARVLGLAARTMTLQNSCCSGLDAIGYAASAIARGEAELAICGGTEAPLHPCPLIEMRAAGLTPSTTEMPERIVRPFDLWRSCGVVAEGASMFILEPETSSRAAYGYIAGYAFANDPAGVVCGGLATAARLALADAGLHKSCVDVVSAWGPGHSTIDAGEADAVLSVFGDALANVAVYSIKAAIGSALGAAPAIQVAAAALSLQAGIVPPTVNWRHPDPACPLNLSSSARSIEHAVTLLNAHGVGNVNSCMLLENN